MRSPAFAQGWRGRWAPGPGVSDAQPSSKNLDNDKQAQNNPRDEGSKQQAILETFGYSAGFLLCFMYGGGHFPLHCERISHIP